MGRARLWGVLMLLVLAPGFVRAETGAGQPSGEAAGRSQEEEAGALRLGDLVPLATALADRKVKLEARLAELKRLDDLERQRSALETLGRDLEERIARLTTSGAYGYDQLAALKASAQEGLKQTRSLLEQAAGGLAEVGEMLAAWTAERQRWAGWKAQVAQEPAARALRPTFTEALAAIDGALKLLRGAESPLVDFQRKAAALQSTFQGVLDQTESLLQALKGDRFRKSRPSMFSSAYREQLDPKLLVDLRTRLEGFAGSVKHTVGGDMAWVLLLQGALSLALGLGIRRRGTEGTSPERWRFVLNRPYAVGFFIGASAVYPLLGGADGAARFLLWIAGAVGAARLAAQLFAAPWRRRLVYLLTALLLLSKFTTVAGVPLPVARLYVAAVGAGGLPLCLWRARESRKAGSPAWYVWALRLGAAVLGVVLGAEVAGYSGLATYLLEASLQTVFLALFAWMFALLTKGALEFLLWGSPLARRAVLRSHAEVVLKRTGAVLDGIAAFLAFAALLFVWRVYDTPWEAIGAILAFGFTWEGGHVSVGVVGAALAVLYAALFASWCLQRFLDERVYPKRRVEWGARVSINRLVQYAFVLAGFLLAISTLGLDLQKFTVLAGALGIGIGFGLQNIVNNFVSGLILLFERPIKAGDLVQLADQWGTVEKIGLRATVVETFDRAEVIVPNSDLVSGQVTNWTLGNRLNRLVIPVGIAYGSDVPLAMKILEEVGRGNPRVLRDPPPEVYFVAFGASSLDFELRVWLADVQERFLLRSELHQEIDRRFREAKVEIAFPQRDLHLRSVDVPARQALAGLFRPSSAPGARGPAERGAGGPAEPGEG